MNDDIFRSFVNRTRQILSNALVSVLLEQSRNTSQININLLNTRSDNVMLQVLNNFGAMLYRDNKR